MGKIGKDLWRGADRVSYLFTISDGIRNTVLEKMTIFRPPPEGWLDVADALPLEGFFIRRIGMTREAFMDILRTAMKVMGGMVLASGLAKSGGLTLDSWNTLTSAVLVLGGLGWSWYSTYHLTK